MSLITKTLESTLLGKPMAFSVYCPDGWESADLPVLYFLHGRTGNEQLLAQLGMDRAADALIASGDIKPLLIVCPNLDNSRGINSSEEYREVAGKYGAVHKGRYEDYLTEELIPFVDASFRTVKDRAGRYIGGVSSGGYTALHVAFRHQDKFSRVGGHMPAVDLRYEDEDECYFADEAMWRKYDPVSLAENARFDGLRVFLDDGTEDEGQFYRACEKLTSVLTRKGVDVQNHLWEGHHDGAYLVSHLDAYLRFYGA